MHFKFVSRRSRNLSPPQRVNRCLVYTRWQSFAITHPSCFLWLRSRLSDTDTIRLSLHFERAVCPLLLPDSHCPRFLQLWLVFTLNAFHWAVKEKEQRREELDSHLQCPTTDLCTHLCLAFSANQRVNSQSCDCLAVLTRCYGACQQKCCLIALRTFKEIPLYLLI